VNVAELKKILADVPDHAEVYYEDDFGGELPASDATPRYKTVMQNSTATAIPVLVIS
jgi:hypothetical protein